jgi:hypothetical protein
LLAAGVSVAAQQAAGSAQSNVTTQTNQVNPSDWRYTPMKLHTHPDTVKDPNDRELRDQYWIKLSGINLPNGRHLTVSGAMYAPRVSDILPIPGSFWAIGVFVDHDVYETDNGIIYSEIHFRLDDVIGYDPDLNPPPQSGQIIDIGIPGGTVLADSGNVVRQIKHVSPRYELQPGKRYLIQLVPTKDGGFHTAADYWEISDGLVVPVLPGDLLMVKIGASHLAGLTEKQAIQYVQQALSTNPRN